MFVLYPTSDQVHFWLSKRIYFGMSCTTEKELVVLEQFRERISYVLPHVDDFSKRDDSLIRWLRARDMNVDKAEKMFCNSFQWRVNNKIDGVLDWTDPEMEKKFPYYMDGVDKKGRPVITFPYGLWDIRSLVESEGGMEKYCLYSHQLLEKIMGEIRRRTVNARNSKNEEVVDGIQFISITDMTGYSYRQMANMKTIQAIIKMTSAYEAHYPETVAQSIVINAPAIFPMLFSICKPFISGRTLEKIQIFSCNKDEWQPAVLDLIEPTQLREQFGGTKLS